MPRRPEPIHAAEFVQLVVDSLTALKPGEELVLYSNTGRYTVTRSHSGLEVDAVQGRTGHLHYRHITEVVLCNDLTITFSNGPRTDPITDMELMSA